MQKNRIRMIVVLDEDGDLKASSNTTHVGQDAWPTPSMLGLGMALLDGVSIEHDPDLRERLVNEVIIKDETPEEKLQKGEVTFWDFVRLEAYSPYVLFIEQRDHYRFEVVSSRPIESVRVLQVLGQQIIAQVFTDVHVHTLGQMQRQVMARRGKIPVARMMPPQNQGNGGILLP